MFSCTIIIVYKSRSYIVEVNNLTDGLRKVVTADATHTRASFINPCKFGSDDVYNISVACPSKIIEWTQREVEAP